MGDVIIEVLGSEPLERQLAIGVCLGRTFQDVGGRLVDVVDEDSAQGRISPGGQFCEEISGVIVPSRDVMQFNSL